MSYPEHTVCTVLSVTSLLLWPDCQLSSLNVSQDVNEHCPLLDSNTYSETIDENTPHGTLVLTVAATDADKHAPNNVIK